MKRHPPVIAALLGVGLFVAGVVYFTVRSLPHGTSSPRHPEPEPPPKNALAAEDQARLPSDRVLLPAADEAECRGLLVSGESLWGVSALSEKSVLWDEVKHYLIVVMPNEKRAELQEKLTPK